MGAPYSAVPADIPTYTASLKQKAVGYFRYVDDILVIRVYTTYYKSLTIINNS
jgi:hypothetical protein